MRDLEGLTEVFPIARRTWPDEKAGMPEYQYRLRKSLASLLEK